MSETVFLSKQIEDDRYKQFLLCVFWTFVWGLAAHAFIFFNLHYNHDSIILADNTFSNGFDFTLGRYVSPAYKFVRGYVSATWLIGMLALLYIAVSSFFICDIFNIKSIAAISIVSGFFSTNINMTVLNSAYTTCCDTFMFSQLCATLAGWCVVKKKRNFRCVLVSSVSLMMSLAIYQAYIGVFCLIVFVYVFYRLINLKYEDLSDTVSLVAKAFIVLFFAVVGYKVGMKIILHIYKLEQNSYLNWNVILDIQSIPKSLAECYSNFFRNYACAPFHQRITALIHVFLLVFVIGNVYTIVSNRIHNKKSNLITLCIIFFVVLIPFVVNIVNFITRFQRNNELTYVSFYLLYLLPLFFCVKFRIIKKIIYSLCFVLIFFNVATSNQIYTKKKIVYDSTTHIVNRILILTNLNDDYIEGETPVVLFGSLGKNKLLNQNYEEFKIFDSVTLSSINSAITYFSTFGGAVKIMNTRVNILPSQDVDLLIRLYAEELNAMSTFPSRRCCRMIDGKMFVKLSDEEIPVFKFAELPDYSIVQDEVSFWIDEDINKDRSRFIRGWAYHGNDICKVLIEVDGMYYAAEQELRPDVQKAFSLNNDKMGFSVTIPNGAKQCSLYLVNEDKKEIYRKELMPQNN